MDAQAQIEQLKAELEAKDAQLAEQAAQLVELQELVAKQARLIEELTEKIERNSRNSNRPPSSDPPGQKGSGSSNKASKKRLEKKRKRGGQPGHRGSHRALLPAEQVSRFVEVFPPRCENCWEALPEIPDPEAKRYQVTEVPPITPTTIEYRRHGVQCACGYTTYMPFESSQIPTSAFGPRLRSLVVLLTGVSHVSRRKTAQLLSDLCGVRISLGSISQIEERVSDTLGPTVAEAWDQVQSAEVTHTDGTSWLQTGKTLSLWTLASSAATVFKIVADSSRATIRPLYGVLRGILVSDRAKVFGFWAMKRRQICWAHLLRKFVSFAERDGPAGSFGDELLEYTGILFEYWHDYKDGKLDKRTFRTRMQPVRDQMEALLERAVAADIPRLSGSCDDILAHRQALWTFVDHEQVEPTNKHAERELRAFVLWRKRSFGTRSQRGNRFAERVMTVAHTARKQGKDILAFLTRCCEAREASTPAPSLFETDISAQA